MPKALIYDAVACATWLATGTCVHHGTGGNAWLGAAALLGLAFVHGAIKSAVKEIKKG